MFDLHASDDLNANIFKFVFFFSWKKDLDDLLLFEHCVV